MFKLLVVVRTDSAALVVNRGQSFTSNSYPLYTALLSDWRVSDSSPLAYLRERTGELADIGAFVHC